MLKIHISFVCFQEAPGAEADLQVTREDGRFTACVEEKGEMFRLGGLLQ